VAVPDRHVVVPDTGMAIPDRYVAVPDKRVANPDTGGTLRVGGRQLGPRRQRVLR